MKRKTIQDMPEFVIGIDFGSDSCRAVLVDAHSGEVCDSATFVYPRWAKGLYCDNRLQQFRQHPLDYIEGLESVLRELASRCSDPSAIKAISVDTTASTPCFVDAQARPLALREEFKDNPNAMFVLWKDHSGKEEAELITRKCAEHTPNIACHTGNDYSPECFWAKVLHILNVDPAVREAGVSLIEECDFIPALLTGVNDYRDIKPGHCVAGAKHFWAEEWGGFPSDEFFASIDPELVRIKHSLNPDNRTSDFAAGHLCPEWAERTGLSTDCIIGYGNVDSHSGAVGAGVREGRIAMTLGTSAGCMLVVSPEKLGGRIIPGVFGQVDGSILPGMVGFEAGLSAFGDAYAWLRRLLSWPAKAFGVDIPEDQIIAKLTEEAAALPLDVDAVYASDHLNGRRTPDPTTDITAAIAGLKITSTAPEIFRALVEATVFGMWTIVDYLEHQGIPCPEVVAMGGIARKSPYIVQMLADVCGRDISVCDSKDCTAMGAALFATVIAGIYPDIRTATDAIGPGASTVYHPDPAKRDYYRARYEKYRALVAYSEM